MEITLGISADGKIAGVEITSYNDTESYDFRAKDPNYLASYVGKDSALADIGTVSGSTFSSTAFKDSVSAAMGVLISNNLVAAGVKGDDQILMELIPTVAPGFTKLEKEEGTGNILKVLTATNGTGYDYIVKNGSATYLAIVDVMGGCKVYDVEGNDVTADNESVVAEVTAHAATKPNKFTGYVDITATLTGLPDSIVAVYKEDSGLGYIVICTAESSYSSAPMDITLDVSADGKIAGVEITAYNDTESYDFRVKDPNYLPSFIGKDSALTDIGTVSGATFSSTAFKESVAAAMDMLVTNNLISAGFKADEQILTEMLPTLHTGLTSGGLLKAEEIPASGNIFAGYKALNGTGYAFIVTTGETKVLALVNASGVCKVYDTTGADVTEANAAVVTEALAAVETTDFTTAAEKMLLAKYADAAKVTAIELPTFSNVAYASTFVSGGNNYYAFYSCPLTYGDHAMAILTVLDENGAIVTQDVKEFLFGHGIEYMPIYSQGYGDVSSAVFGEYEGKFPGLTSDTLTDDVLVSGATISSTAVKLATQDAFNAFNALKGGAQ
jgi:uncharacterized protein with FMN-binding domain